ncbi:MAG: hypothetical protein GXX83_04965 [Gaiellales bacterium]|nr:hypothetical protein [Gaiellales bacterium]
MTDQAHKLIRRCLAEGRRVLDEVEARELLTAYDIPVAAYRRVDAANDGSCAPGVGAVVDAANRLGYPVVLKALVTGALHKTDAGLVALNLRTECELRAAHADLTAHAGQPCSMLVERMIPGHRELLVGLSRDPQFGAAVAFGTGGVFAEALHDVALSLAPLSPVDAETMLQLVRGQALLGAVRGLPPASREALTGILSAVGRMAVEHPEIEEIDINPLLLPDSVSDDAASTGDARTGVHPVAVDALVTLRAAGHPGSNVMTDSADHPAPARFSPTQWEALFRPRAIIVAGASGNPAKWGGSLLVNLLQNGFPGTVYPINAHADAVLGMPAYPTIAHIPGKADLALAAVPAAHLAAVIKAAAAKGVRAVVAVTAGFGEHDAAGRDLERHVAQTARECDVLLLGPNTAGVLSTPAHMFGLGAVALDVLPGRASLIAQSGNVSIALLLAAHEAGLGISKVAGLGNEALTSAADLVQFLTDDPETDLVMAYIEGIRDGRRFYEIARRCTRRKPLVVLRGGLSERGRRAVVSHTGALAGSADVFLAAARQAGVIVTTDQDDLVDTSIALSRVPLPQGRQVAVVCSGGGWGVLCADELTRQGLSLAELPADLVTDLDGVLPELWSRGNPLDLVATVDREAVAYAVDRLLSHPQVDAVLLLGILSMPFMLRRVCARAAEFLSSQRTMASQSTALESARATLTHLAQREQDLADICGPLMERHGKPILAVEFHGTARARPRTDAAQSHHQLVTFPSPLRACRALAHLAWYKEYLRSPAG